MITGIASTTAQSSSARTAIFGIVCSAHFINHFQSAMLGVIYPLMMKELGMGYMAIASLAAVYNTLGSVFQALYGFVVPYVRRGVILGVGNCLLGLSVVASGFASSFHQFFATRLLGGLGSSPQHPVGSSILASHFGAARGRMLAFHSTAGQLGSLVAPLLAALLITWLGWRGVFWTVGALATVMGMICFVFRDSLRTAVSDKTKSRLTPLGWEAYKTCLKNKNILLVSLVFMAGAAGRGQDINEVYIIPHFVRDFHLDITYGAFLFTFIQVGSLIGPFVWGWVSDRFNRKLVIQASLLVSALSTFWLAWQETVSASLFFNLVIYGAAVDVATDPDPGAAQRSGGRGPLRCGLQPLLFHRLRLDSFLDGDYGRGHDKVRLRSRLQCHLDFLSPRDESPGPPARSGKDPQCGQRLKHTIVNK